MSDHDQRRSHGTDGPAALDAEARAELAADAQRSELSAGMDQGLRVLSYLISGVLVYGFLGWVGDHFLGTHFLLPLGIILGAGLSIYVIIRRFALDQGLTPATRLSEASGRISTARHDGASQEGER